jgi:hypothetical protein
MFDKKNSMFFLTLTAFGHLCFIVQPVSASLIQPDNLHLVKRIRVAEESSSKEPATEQTELTRRLTLALKDELMAAGFVVVDNQEDADAVLSGKTYIWIVDDGPPDDPTRFTYEYQLTSPTAGRIWSTKFNIYSRSNWEEIDKAAAKKIVGRLLREWRRSAKRAGISKGSTFPFTLPVKQW